MRATTSNRDPRIDAYIARSAEFARPILSYLREVVHEGCPQATETLKWNTPSFEYKGLLCGIAAFKQHCTFGFWKHSLVVEDDAAASGGPTAGKAASATKSGGARAAGKSSAGESKVDEAMGQFGRITRLSDLPPKKVLLGYIRKAAKLNDEGVKIPRPKRAPSKPLPVPADLAAALKKNKSAAQHFEAFSPSKRKDYIEWLTDAKTAETRQRRLTTAIEWIAEGKGRNWKYERC